jgi:hypothetical protein
MNNKVIAISNRKKFQGYSSKHQRRLVKQAIYRKGAKKISAYEISALKKFRCQDNL